MATKRTATTTTTKPSAAREANKRLNDAAKTKAKREAASKAKAAPATAKQATAKPIKPASPLVYRDGNAHMYIGIGKQQYITTRLGYIGIEQLSTEAIAKLTPNPYGRSFADAIKPYNKTTLTISDEARAVIDAINSNDDPARDCFAIDGKPSKRKPSSKANGKAKPNGTAKASGKRQALDGHVTLAELLAEFNLDGKRVRAKLRATMTKPAHGWQWPKAEAAAIRKICVVMAGNGTSH